MIFLSDRDQGTANNFNLLRMVAATAVLISHAYPLSSGRDTPQPLEAILAVDYIGDDLGRAAVFVFFAISGFFITRSFQRQSSIWSFARARLLRIYPGLVVMTAVTLTGLWLFGPTTASARDYLTGIAGYVFNTLSLYLPNFLSITDIKGSLPPDFLQGAPHPTAVNGSLWSLTFEAVCYIGVALAGIIGLFTRRRAFLAALALFVGVYLLTFPAGGFFIERIFYTGLPFAIGAAFWVFRDRVPLSLPVLIGLGLAAWALDGTVFFRPSFVLALSYGVFLIGFARIPYLHAYNRLGDYSYGMYIYAYPVQQLAVIHGADTPWLNAATAFPLTLVLAMLSWHLVEKPALGWKHKVPAALGPTGLAT